jgi:hypothetical protein
MVAYACSRCKRNRVHTFRKECVPSVRLVALIWPRVCTPKTDNLASRHFTVRLAGVLLSTDAQQSATNSVGIAGLLVVCLHSHGMIRRDDTDIDGRARPGVEPAAEFDLTILPIRQSPIQDPTTPSDAQ